MLREWSNTWQYWLGGAAGACSSCVLLPACISVSPRRCYVSSAADWAGHADRSCRRLAAGSKAACSASSGSRYWRYCQAMRRPAEPWAPHLAATCRPQQGHTWSMITRSPHALSAPWARADRQPAWEGCMLRAVQVPATGHPVMRPFPLPGSAAGSPKAGSSQQLPAAAAGRPRADPLPGSNPGLPGQWR